jgi:hypothetical protein
MPEDQANALAATLRADDPDCEYRVLSDRNSRGSFIQILDADGFMVGTI